MDSISTNGSHDGEVSSLVDSTPSFSPVDSVVGCKTSIPLGSLVALSPLDSLVSLSPLDSPNVSSPLASTGVIVPVSLDLFDVVSSSVGLSVEKLPSPLDSACVSSPPSLEEDDSDSGVDVGSVVIDCSSSLLTKVSGGLMGTL